MINPRRFLVVGLLINNEEVFDSFVRYNGLQIGVDRIICWIDGFIHTLVVNSLRESICFNN